MDSYIPYFIVDASYFKVGEGVGYLHKALLPIAGIWEDGMQEIPIARIADCENELTGEDLFSELRDRGFEKTDLVISDSHRGIQSAGERSFPGSSWQMCQVHFIRAVMRKIPRRHFEEIARLLNESLSDPRRPQKCATELEAREYLKAAGYSGVAPA